MFKLFTYLVNDRPKIFTYRHTKSNWNTVDLPSNDLNNNSLTASRRFKRDPSDLILTKEIWQSTKRIEVNREEEGDRFEEVVSLRLPLSIVIYVWQRRGAIDKSSEAPQAVLTECVNYSAPQFICRMERNFCVNVVCFGGIYVTQNALEEGR